MSRVEQLVMAWLVNLMHHRHLLCTETAVYNFSFCRTTYATTVLDTTMEDCIAREFLVHAHGRVITGGVV